jgi:dihydroxyacid dehydratase/phosphogluconate dehydratase
MLAIARAAGIDTTNQTANTVRKTVNVIAYLSGNCRANKVNVRTGLFERFPPLNSC